MIVHFRFSAAVAKQASLLRTLLEFQGVNLSGGLLEEPVPEGAADLILLGLDAGSPELMAENRDRRWDRCLVMILNPSEQEPPPGVLEFSSEGVQRLLRRVGRPLRAEAAQPDTGEERHTPGPERRRWDLKRFRYGLWLEFARVTGSGKFDPYPLMNSKRGKIEKALTAEMGKYVYDHESSGPELLAEALEHVWNSFEDRFPCAVHVVDAVAEHIWETASPSMPERRYRSAQFSDDQSRERSEQPKIETVNAG